MASAARMAASMRAASGPPRRTRNAAGTGARRGSSSPRSRPRAPSSPRRRTERARAATARSPPGATPGRFSARFPGHAGVDDAQFRQVYGHADEFAVGSALRFDEFGHLAGTAKAGEGEIVFGDQAHLFFTAASRVHDVDAIAGHRFHDRLLPGRRSAG